jgi:hypothetical protein
MSGGSLKVAALEKRVQDREATLDRLLRKVSDLCESQLKVGSKNVTVVSDTGMSNGTDIFFVRGEYEGWKEPGDVIAEISFPECKGKQIVTAWTSSTGHGRGLNAYRRLCVIPKEDRVVLHAIRFKGQQGANTFTIHVLYK